MTRLAEAMLESLERVPEEMPPRLPVPGSTWRPHWTTVPLMLPLVLLRPRWMSGPIGAAGLWSAFLAHSVSYGVMLLGMASMQMWMMTIYSSDLAARYSTSSIIRDVLASFWVELMSTLSEWRIWLPVIGGALVFEVGMLLWAWLLMPWVAAGERRWPAYRRSLKVIWWASAGVMLFPLGMIALFWFSQWMSASSYLDGYVLQQEYIYSSIFMLSTVWTVILLDRLGDTYCGPAVGALFEPQPLRCRACGYELTMQPLDSRCPECNLPVAEALPATRPPLPFAEASSWLSRIRLFQSTWLQSLRGNTFGKQLRVYSARRASRQFAMNVSLVVGMFAVLTAFLFADPWEQDLYVDEFDLTAVYVAQATTAYCLGVCMSIGLIAGMGTLVSGFGFSEPERKTTVVAFSSGWLIPCAVAVMLGTGWTWLVFEKWEIRGSILLPVLNTYVAYEAIWAIPGFIPAGSLGILWLLHIRKLLRATRYACV
jgi:hypothetical protein